MHLSFKTSTATKSPAKTRRFSASLLTAAALAALSLFPQSTAQAAEPRLALGASVSPARLLRSAHLLGRLDPGAMLHAEFVLPPRNQAALETLLRRQYTPGDPLYRHFLTPDQFAAQFGPTPQDYAAVAAYARTQGLTVTGTTPGRTLLPVSGSTAKIEAAFGVQMNQYRLPSGRVGFSSSAAPTLPRSIAARLSGVVGLSNLAVMHPQLRLRPNAPAPITGSGGIGSGPLGGLSPNDIKYAYGLNTITTLYGQTGAATSTTAAPLDGAGQNIGLFELDGFVADDIAQYVAQFALPTLLTGSAAPVTTRLLAPYKGVPLNINGQTEVTLDIDMVLALAPNSTGIYVYEADPSQTSPLDVFTAMATDKNSSGLPLLQVISCSWGLDEADTSLDLINAENAVFQQMAAQGQSVFSAAGDNGAYDAFFTTTTGTVITTTGLTAPAVDNPASQPYVTGVGGTKLGYVKPGASTPGSYTGESVWSAGSPAVDPEGGGGGISSIWSKPAYQTSGASPNRRDVPDVALNSDPNTGYSIFVGSVPSATAGTAGTPGVAEVVGGTSAAAPLWAAYTALVNQRRTANGLGPVGFLNPVIYPLLNGSSYTALFHDIVDGDNLFYQAGPGYDDASGLGSFNGLPLLTALSLNANQGTGTATISGTVTDTAAPPAPIAGATVSASTVGTSGAGTVVATATTDSAGTYTLSVPGGLALRLTVTVPAPVAPATAIFSGATTTLAALADGSAVTLPFALAPAHLYASGLQMISVPYDYSGLGDFAAAFGLTATQAATTTRLVKFVPGSNSYAFYPTSPADTFRLGQGYWTRLPAAGGYLHTPGVPASTSQPFSLPLQAGWNQIGDPFLQAAPLSGITVSGSGTSAVPLASAPTLVQAKLYGYDPAANAYTVLDLTNSSLSPYTGYWIYAFQPCTLTIPVPAGTTTPPGIPGVPGG